MAKSPNHKNGRFVNKLPADNPPFLKSLKEWVKGGNQTVPKGPVPVVKRTAEDFDALPPIDAVLISHDHYDHLDVQTVKNLAGTGVTFVVPLGVGGHLSKWDIPSSQFHELDWWDHVKIKEITVTATPARHFSGRSIVMADRDQTLWAGFAMVGDRHKVYYTGDTGMFPGFAEIGERLGPFDATLVEIGAYDLNRDGP